MSESLRSSTEMLLLSADFKKFPANKPLWKWLCSQWNILCYRFYSLVYSEVSPTVFNQMANTRKNGNCSWRVGVGPLHHMEKPCPFYQTRTLSLGEKRNRNGWVVGRWIRKSKHCFVYLLFLLQPTFKASLWAFQDKSVTSGEVAWCLTLNMVWRSAGLGASPS